MVIISQDRYSVINSNYIQSIEYRKGAKSKHCLFVETINERIKIGEYKSYKKAIEILKEVAYVMQLAEMFSKALAVEFQEDALERATKEGLSPIQYVMPKDKKWNMDMKN